MEVIIGVLIGAGIGYIAAITTLVVEHRRWKKEFKLQYLITERIRREKQCDRIRELLTKALNENLNPAELATTLWIRLPQKVNSLIVKAWKNKHNQLEEKQKLNQEVSTILANYLVEIDKQIEELTK